MRLSSIVFIAGSFVAAALLCLLTAFFSAQMIESASRTGVLNELDRENLTWAEVDTNGLQVFLIGTAPDEAARFKALATAGRVVDASRVIDQMLVVEPEDLAPPRFSVEILRNDAGISVIGLVPKSTDREELIESFAALVPNGEASDLLESADFPAPEGWDEALRYASTALRDLPRSKISVEAGFVRITAMAESEERKVRLETLLNRRKPETMRLALDISAPRPVISPFTLRFIIDEEGARFDACSADTEASRDRILRAANRAGMNGKASCTLGLGVPSRRWADAVDMAITELAELGGGTVTFSNADITLAALEGTPQATFDRVIGELEASLPEVFALHAILPKAPDASTEGPPEFTATLSPEGRVQLRGRLSSEIARQTADSYAKARFGSQSVFTAARVAENLPADWPARTLAGLEALSKLANGQITVTPDDVIVIGQTGNQEAGAEIATLLAAKLGDSATFEIDVEYVKRLDASLGIPTPQECEARIVESIGARKLSFEPGSATLDASAKEILDDLAVLLKTCGDIPLEIGGHTDSQGREEMNQRLSQDRAQSVLDALRGRLVPTRNYTVIGYGEMQPVADNDTEEGREANRRIEFKLIESKIADALAGETAFDETEAPAEEMANEATASEAAAETDDARAEASGEGAEAETAPVDEASESSEDDLGEAPAETAEAAAQNDAQTETEEPLQDPEATEAAAGIGADKAVPEGAVRASDFVPEDSDS